MIRSLLLFALFCVCSRVFCQIPSPGNHDFESDFNCTNGKKYHDDSQVEICESWFAYRHDKGEHKGSTGYSILVDGLLTYCGGRGMYSDEINISRELENISNDYVLTVKFRIDDPHTDERTDFKLLIGDLNVFVGRHADYETGFSYLENAIASFIPLTGQWYLLEVAQNKHGMVELRIWEDNTDRPYIPLVQTYNAPSVPARLTFVGGNLSAPQVSIDWATIDNNEVEQDEYNTTIFIADSTVDSGIINFEIKAPNGNLIRKATIPLFKGSTPEQLIDSLLEKLDTLPFIKRINRIDECNSIHFVSVIPLKFFICEGDTSCDDHDELKQYSPSLINRLGLTFSRRSPIFCLKGKPKGGNITVNALDCNVRVFTSADQELPLIAKEIVHALEVDKCMKYKLQKPLDQGKCIVFPVSELNSIIFTINDPGITSSGKCDWNAHIITKEGLEYRY